MPTSSAMMRNINASRPILSTILKIGRLINSRAKTIG